MQSILWMPIAIHTPFGVQSPIVLLVFVLPVNNCCDFSSLPPPKSFYLRKNWGDSGQLFEWGTINCSTITSPALLKPIDRPTWRHNNTLPSDVISPLLKFTSTMRFFRQEN